MAWRQVLRLRRAARIAPDEDRRQLDRPAAEEALPGRRLRARRVRDPQGLASPAKTRGPPTARDRGLRQTPSRPSRLGPECGLARRLVRVRTRAGVAAPARAL